MCEYPSFLLSSVVITEETETKTMPKTKKTAAVLALPTRKSPRSPKGSTEDLQIVARASNVGKKQAPKEVEEEDEEPLAGVEDVEEEEEDDNEDVLEDDEAANPKKKAAAKKKKKSLLPSKGKFITTDFSLKTVDAFAKRLGRREKALAKYKSPPDSAAAKKKSSDDDDDDVVVIEENGDRALGPIFVKLQEKSIAKKDYLRSLTNFTADEFLILWTQVEDIILTKLKAGSGKKSSVHPMDAFLFLLAQLKAGTPVATTCKLFSIESNVFWRAILGILTKCSFAIYEWFVEEKSMEEYRKLGKTFVHYPSAIEAIDVTFQQSYARGREFGDRKMLFSGKHFDYGLKTEMAVGPDGKCRFVGTFYVGSWHDMKIFRDNLPKHLRRLTKSETDKELKDTLAVANDKESTMWAALCDKGYQGARKYGRFISPKKNTARRNLDQDDKERNADLEQDRVIVENFFGRLKLLWGQMDEQYRLGPKMYKPIMFVAVALTNFHISLLPLRKDDGDVERNYNQRMEDAFNVAKKKTAAKQQEYRAKKKQRLDYELHGNGADADNADDADDSEDAEDANDDDNQAQMDDFDDNYNGPGSIVFM